MRSSVINYLPLGGTYIPFIYYRASESLKMLRFVFWYCYHLIDCFWVNVIKGNDFDINPTKRFI